MSHEPIGRRPEDSNPELVTTEQVEAGQIPVALEDDDPLEMLRVLLLEQYRGRVQELEQETSDARRKLYALENRISDTSELMATITPVIAHSIQQKIREAPNEMIDALSPIIADAVRTSIADSREAMVEALYPITGQLVQRAVSEAMRDLARRIDAQMRTTLDFASLLRKLRAMLGFAPSSETILRHLLPFEVQDVLLIHRETGLLLRHQTRPNDVQSANQEEDSMMIGGMLTAIRDFASDVLGDDSHGSQGQLTEIQYGERLILLEAAHSCYLAAVITGVEESGYRAKMREVVYAIDNQAMRELRDFSGDTSLFANTDDQLKTLLHPL